METNRTDSANARTTLQRILTILSPAEFLQILADVADGEAQATKIYDLKLSYEFDAINDHALQALNDLEL